MSDDFSPDERSLRAALDQAPFQSQVGTRWGEPQIEWPFVYLWLKARPINDDGGRRYWLRINCAGYPQQAPTATFWDMERKSQLEAPRRPWGTGEVALAFRTDWPGAPYGAGGSAFYLLCDRVGLQTHGDWTAAKYPGSIWKPTKGIIYYLNEVSRLLNSTEYSGPLSPEP